MKQKTTVKKQAKIIKAKIVKAGPKKVAPVSTRLGILKTPPKVASSPNSSLKKVVIPKLAAQVFDTQGGAQGTINLPKEIFGQTPNQNLLAQTVRVYFANQSVYAAHTKTRGEVHGGGRKPHRQKGTGRARAGSIRSPLWVGGGIALGPRYREVRLSLPKKMKHKALTHSLSLKLKSGDIKVIQNIEKIEPKTKIIANLLSKLQAKGNTLLVLSANPPAGGKNVKLASRNIPQVSVEIAPNLNAYVVLKNNQLLISKEATNSFRIK